MFILTRQLQGLATGEWRDTPPVQTIQSDDLVELVHYGLFVKDWTYHNLGEGESYFTIGVTHIRYLVTEVE